ncbi:hypothetical protein BH10BAC5_BH10BAC5_14070 [soil metagenome]
MKIILIIFVYTGCIYSQPTLQWDFKYSPSSGTNVALSVISDDSGYIYSTGAIQPTNQAYYKCLLTKHLLSGDTAWFKIDGLDNDYQAGGDLILDSLKNIYVSGNPFLRKFDRNGNLIWKKSDSLSSVILPGNFILKDKENKLIIGSEGVVGGNNSKIVVSKIDPTNGNLIWRQTVFTEASNHPLGDIKLDKNGNIVVVGQYGGSTPPEYSDLIVARISSEGSLLWQKRFDGLQFSSSYDIGYGIDVDDSNNIFASGLSENAAGGGDFFTIKFKPEGDTVWTRRFNLNGGGSQGNDLDVDRNGNIYITGLTGVSNFTTIKYTNKGIFQWYRTLPGVSYPYWPVQCLDTSGNVYVACEYQRGSAKDIQVCKYDPNGNQLWVSIYPGTGSVGSSHAEKIITDKFNNVIVAGVHNYDYLVLKYSQTVNIIRTDEIIPNNYKLYQNYPNPFNPVTKIKFSIPENINHSKQQVDIVISDISGKVIEKNSESLSSGVYEKTWEAKYFPSGIYFYTLHVNGLSIQTKKMILLK